MSHIYVYSPSSAHRDKAALRRGVARLEALGHTVKFVTPADFRTIPMPTYPEIRLALTAPGAVGRRLAKIAPSSG